MDRANTAAPEDGDRCTQIDLTVHEDGVHVVLGVSGTRHGVWLVPGQARELARALVEAARACEARARGGAS